MNDDEKSNENSNQDDEKKRKELRNSFNDLNWLIFHSSQQKNRWKEEMWVENDEIEVENFFY